MTVNPKVKAALERAQEAAGPFPSIVYPDRVWDWWSAAGRALRLDPELDQDERRYAVHLLQRARSG